MFINYPLKEMKIVIVIAVSTIIIVTSFIFNKMRELNYRQTDDTALTSTISMFPSIMDTSAPSSVQATTSGLENAVKKALSDTSGSYGIVVKNLKTGESYFLNEHKTYEPASLYKLWVMAATFKQLEAGSLKEDEVLSEDVQVLNDKFHIDPENAELKEGTITLRVSDALNLMIDNSDNYAALLLAERIRNANIQKYLEEHGFEESSLGEPPQTTPYDIALFFEKLYKGELASGENTQKMMNVLKKQTLNSKLPKYLPQDTLIAHKTGEIGYFTHDAGIVFSDKGDYVIVAMSESDSPAGAEERISDVSKAVFEYFDKSGTKS
jgi:beta-lactamase class A